MRPQRPGWSRRTPDHGPSARDGHRTPKSATPAAAPRRGAGLGRICV